MDSEKFILQYLNDLSTTTSGLSFRDILGQDTSKWRIVSELSGGNMNFTYVVEGETNKQIIVKYAAPFVKILRDWKLNQKRSGFEIDHLLLGQKYAPHTVPTIYHYEKEKAIIVMEYMENALTLREALFKEYHKGENASVNLDKVAQDVSEYLSRILFFTSDFYLPIMEKMQFVAKYAENYELIQITDQLIFSEPYKKVCSNNSWDVEIDEVVRTIQSDNELHIGVYHLKNKFRNLPQAWIHGDLHTGSILVDPKSKLWIIDPEFCYYGPMGFDIGLFVGNMLITYICETQKGKDGNDYLKLIENTWNLFAQKFSLLIKENKSHGDFYSINDEFDPTKPFLENLFIDSLGFGACEMIRRIIGVATCYDTKWITDPIIKHEAEKRILDLGSRLIKNSVSREFKSIKSLIDLTKSI